MIKVHKVSKSYPPKVSALKDITFEIQPGEFVSIVGQSGAGKSTLVKLLIAEESPSSGTIEIGGWNITHIKQSEIPDLRKQIGVVFQDFKLLPKKTVFENIAFALEVSGVKDQEIAVTIPKILKMVNLVDKAQRYPHQLSGGEQQRVVIARSLVHKPKLLVADEPTGNLDAINSRDIIDVLKQINDLGTTVLLVTHNREIVNGLKQRVLTIENGELISDQKKGKYLL
ncbi:MAG: cell division ATP-binding protein FtsE [Candidatus Komeilibacteria bacterium]